MPNRKRRKQKRRAHKARNGGTSSTSSNANLLLAALPVFDETADRYGAMSAWPGARYDIDIKSGGSAASPEWEVIHNPQELGKVEDVVKQGDAVYAVEWKNDYMLDAHLATSIEPKTVVAPSPAQIGRGTLHISAGIVTTKACTLDCSGSYWPHKQAQVAAGRWLARAAPMPVPRTTDSPLRFRPDKSIAKGGSSIVFESIGDDLRLVIKAHPETIDQLKFGVGLTGCWATALAMFKHQPRYEITHNDNGEPVCEDSPTATAVASRLRHEKPDMPLWDTEEWDPMLAATSLDALRIHDAGPEEEDPDQ